MIAGIFHQGSGIGNQLHRYVATRILALDRGFEFGMVAPELCKVKDFMNLDMGLGTPLKEWRIEEGTGKTLLPIRLPLSYPLWEEKTNYYNPEFNFIKNNTIIDGEFQDERYWGHHKKKVSQWLEVEYLEVPDDVCVIGFRGGEFYVFPELGLPKSYFDEAIARMLQINPNMRFEVHTDDPVLAQQFFPDYPIISNAGINWRSMRYAKHAIISNSSFYILPRWLKQRNAYTAKTIAPRYWARRNIGEWSMPQNYYRCFTYL